MAPPAWVILAIIGGLSSNLFNFLSRYVLRENDDATSWAWFYETMRLPVFLLISLFDYKLNLTAYSAFLLVALGITEGISVYLYMKMHQYSDLSISTIISRTRLIWIPLIGFIFIGEKLMPIEYFGIILLFAGVATTMAPHKLFVDKGAIYANLAAVVIAVNVILLKLASSYASASIILFCYSVPAALFFPIIMRNAKKRLMTSAGKNFFPKVVAMFASVGAGYFLVLALQTGEVSKVNGIYQGMMVTGVVAGIILLKERKDILRKLLGTALAIIGILMFA